VETISTSFHWLVGLQWVEDAGLMGTCGIKWRGSICGTLVCAFSGILGVAGKLHVVS